MKAPEPESVNAAPASATAQQHEAEIKLVRQALEEARQRVKKIIKRELQGEVVSSDLLNFRLKNVGRA